MHTCKNPSACARQTDGLDGGMSDLNARTQNQKTEIKTINGPKRKQSYNTERSNQSQGTSGCAHPQRLTETPFLCSDAFVAGHGHHSRRWAVVLTDRPSAKTRMTHLEGARPCPPVSSLSARLHLSDHPLLALFGAHSPEPPS